MEEWKYGSGIILNCQFLTTNKIATPKAPLLKASSIKPPVSCLLPPALRARCHLFSFFHSISVSLQLASPVISGHTGVHREITVEKKFKQQDRI